jgi:hypothetical protein
VKKGFLVGSIIRTLPSQVQPSQNFLKEDTLHFIADAILTKHEEKLPPTPIVRRKPFSDQFIAIDGHNLLAIFVLMNRECTLYIAENANDILTIADSPQSSEEALQKRNADLKMKFDQVLEDVKNLEVAGITSFKDLIAKYDVFKQISSVLVKGSDN